MPERDLASVRAELQRRGYLTHAVERALLQDALRPRATAAALLRLALRVGALAGAAVALALAVGLVAANGGLGSNPLDVLILAAHLYLPAALGVAVAFSVLCAVPVVALRLSPQRGVEAVSLATALAAAGGAAAVALWAGRARLAEVAAWQVAVLAVAAPLALAAVARLLYDGFLALAIRLTELVPRGARLRGRTLALAAAAVAVVLLAPLVAARPSRNARAGLPAVGSRRAGRADRRGRRTAVRGRVPDVARRPGRDGAAAARRRRLAALHPRSRRAGGVLDHGRHRHAGGAPRRRRRSTASARSAWRRRWPATDRCAGGGSASRCRSASPSTGRSCRAAAAATRSGSWRRAAARRSWR